ncbi:hypothetical protein [Streptomyces roseochromogenus]|uniref:Cupin domain-containing protein n=1 Tax=Streptomyces roseochromogenus subsp. oscitans DS 12.976 TaxID=1352936 RepID=V6K5E6_STRRC|nr:hypothetical protein [Streptomyces roseochromogenus]EST27415.1 hypothetical protein M878_25800 [Streptomyces roseochromogenus subsp. oscitans DS 12.976]
MKSVQIIPGLAVDEEMFNAAVTGLAEHLPDEHLTWDRFTSESNWTLIPDLDGVGYKAELLLRREAECTAKINLWLGPDLRDGAAPKPHNHPWEFTAFILLGGYTEQRYEVVDGQVTSTTQVHQAGGQNHLPLTTFHEVTAIAEPGRTLTLMVCGAGRKGEWGYIDPESGEFEANQPDPGFRARLVAINPRLR